MHHRNQQREAARSTDPDGVAEQKQDIKAGQRAERQNLLDEINDDFGGE